MYNTKYLLKYYGSFEALQEATHRLCILRWITPEILRHQAAVADYLKNY